jgi:hypothetical protein
MSSIQHLNAAPTADCFAAHANLNLGGAAGEIFKGQTGAGTVDWLTPERRGSIDVFLGRRAGERAVERWRGWMTGMPSPGVGYVMGRLRRFTTSARRIESAWGVHTRLPYADPRFLSLVLSFPDDQLAGGRLARHMLLTAFPELFGTIPSTREAALAANSVSRAARTTSMKARGWLGRSLGKWGLQFRDRRNYQDVGAWLRQPPARGIVEHLLLTGRPRFKELGRGEEVVAEVAAHMAGRERTKTVGSFLTLELWLRQLEDESYRTGLEGIDDPGNGRESFVTTNDAHVGTSHS